MSKCIYGSISSTKFTNKFTISSLNTFRYCYNDTRFNFCKFLNFI